MPGREVQDGLDPRGDDEVHDLLRRACRHGDDGDADAFVPDDPLELRGCRGWRRRSSRPGPPCRSTCRRGDDLEAFLTESRIVRQRESQIAGTHDRDAEPPVEAEDRAEMPAEILDVVPDAADAELAEPGQVLPDLGGVQMKALRETLR